MQIYLANIYTAAALGVTQIGDGMAVIVAGGAARLLYSQADMNNAYSYNLGSLAAPGSGYVSHSSLSSGISSGNLQPGRAIAFHDTGSTIRAFFFDAQMGNLTSTTLDNSGAPGAVQVVSTSIGALKGVETFAMIGGASGQAVAISNYNAPGLDLFKIETSGVLTLKDSIDDTAKSYVANVSDTATVKLGGKDYLLTLSSLENGLTSYEVNTAQKAALVDSVGNHDGLWVSGSAALQVTELAGVTYAIIASTGSSSLSVVRVNQMGCLFVTDHIVDDLTTRFAHTQVLDTFTVNNRVFVASAGTDAGVTVLELLPNGTLQPLVTGIFETGGGLFNVTALDAVVAGSMVDFYVADAQGKTLKNYELNLGTLGQTVFATAGSATGTGLDDRLWGSTGNETLSGGSGDDWIHDGGGRDTMTGGAGADVFVFGATSHLGRITDFDLHRDRIDISAWGRVYTLDALTVTATANGATIALNGHSLSLTTLTGQSLNASQLTDADFIF